MSTGHEIVSTGEVLVINPAEDQDKVQELVENSRWHDGERYLDGTPVDAYRLIAPVPYPEIDLPPEDIFLTVELIETQKAEEERQAIEAERLARIEVQRATAARLPNTPDGDYSDVVTKEFHKVYPEELAEETIDEIESYRLTNDSGVHNVVDVQEAPLPAVIEKMPPEIPKERLRDRVADFTADYLDWVAVSFANQRDGMIQVTDHSLADVPQYQQRELARATGWAAALDEDSEEINEELLEQAEKAVARIGAKPRIEHVEGQPDEVLSYKKAMRVINMAYPERRLGNVVLNKFPGLWQEELHVRIEATEIFMNEVMPIYDLHTRLQEEFHPTDRYPNSPIPLWNMYMAVRDLRTTDEGIEKYFKKIKSSGMPHFLIEPLVERLRTHVKEQIQLKEGENDAN